MSSNHLAKDYAIAHVYTDNLTTICNIYKQTCKRIFCNLGLFLSSNNKCPLFTCFAQSGQCLLVYRSFCKRASLSNNLGQCLNIQTVITARQKSSNGPFHSNNFLCVSDIDQQFWAMINVYITKMTQ